MKIRILAAPLLALAALALLGAWIAGGPAAAQAPAPSAGEVLASGLLQPRGLTVGPDDMIYVAEAGTGGDTDFTMPDGTVLKNGFTGRISKVDADTGTRSTVADGLPSQAMESGEAIGPADVAFIGGTLYLLLTHGGADFGFPDTPTGIYRVKDDGTLALVADIGAFNKANPVKAITDGVQQDIEPGGNPYSFIVRNGIFYVSDGNHNRLLKVTTGGDVSAITEFPNHPVSTGVANTASGPFYVGYLGQGPFLPEAGKVVSVAPTTGAITEIASGAAMITDVQVGAGGQLYALQFNDPQEAGEAFFAPGTGKVLRVVGSGFSPLITGLSFATDMVFDGNTLYISNFGIAPVGEVIKVENFSSVTPPAATPTTAPPQAPTQAPPQATATRPGGIVAPSTGTGGTGGAGGDGGTPWLLLAGLAVAGTTLLGSAAALRSKGR